MSSSADATTVLLQRLREGSVEARDELVARHYEQFRQRAHRHRRAHERPNHTLATTDLTNEALARLLAGDELARAANGRQLARAFGRAMRQLLVDHARRRAAAIRGGGWQRHDLDDLTDDIRAASRLDVLDLHDALAALADGHPFEAEVLELHYFSGLTMAEIAAEAAEPLTAVERAARFGKAWLRARLTSEAP